MAKKSIDGQMDMFELFSSVEELEQKVKGVHEEETVMRRCFSRSDDGEEAVLAYMDYNKVYLRDWKKKPEIHQFDSAKEAVDFYVEQMERLRKEETKA